jgi:hypothetical protein
MKNETIDHKILAKHFDTTNENMRQHIRKHEKLDDEAKKYSTWINYVKAYNWDTL